MNSSISSFSTPTKTVTKELEAVLGTNNAVKSYPVLRSPDSGRIRFPLSPETRRKGGIYVFSRGKKYYAGKAEKSDAGNCFEKRLNKHSSDIYLHHKDSDLHTDLNAHPEDFTVSVLPVSPNKDINKIERTFIRKLRADECGYNRNNGGGGGNAIQEDRKGFEPPKHTVTTPEKWYSIKNQRVVITPNKTMKQSNVVYQLMNPVTGQRYNGCSVRPVEKRIHEEIRASQNPKSRVYNSRLMKALRKSTDQFKVGILYTLKEKTGVYQLRSLEAFSIHKTGKKYPLLNGNCGKIFSKKNSKK